MLGLPVGRAVEVAIALALAAGGVFLYRRRGAEDPRHGSQSAVLLLAVAAIMLIHGSGLLDYHPSPAELGR